MFDSKAWTHYALSTTNVRAKKEARKMFSDSLSSADGARTFELPPNPLKFERIGGGRAWSWGCLLATLGHIAAVPPLSWEL